MGAVRGAQKEEVRRSYGRCRVCAPATYVLTCCVQWVVVAVVMVVVDGRGDFSQSFAFACLRVVASSKKLTWRSSGTVFLHHVYLHIFVYVL